jgi:uncharacterized damage-inducible protein DinB
MQVLSLLDESRAFFQTTVSAVPETEATRRLTPEGWSIAGIVEHIVIAERALLGRFDNAEKSEDSLCNPERETQMLAGLRNRSTRIPAPERAWPAGRFDTVAEALQQFLAARDKTIRFAREHEPELYHFRVAHPFFGTVNGAEMLIVIASHSSRHADQILEIRSGYATMDNDDTVAAENRSG